MKKYLTQPAQLNSSTKRISLYTDYPTTYGTLSIVVRDSWYLELRLDGKPIGEVVDKTHIKVCGLIKAYTDICIHLDHQSINQDLTVDSWLALAMLQEVQAR